MRIVIVGGGVVGYSLAEHLIKDKHRLSLVEMDPVLCGTISEKLDLQIVCGSGSSPSALLAAGLPEADMVLAVTPSDEVNMVVCAVAAQSAVGKRIARLRNQEFASENAAVDIRKIGITHVIHPEEVLVDHILQYVETPHALESANFERGQILMRGYRVHSEMPIAGHTPAQIRAGMDSGLVLFAAIVRNGKGMIPSGDTPIETGDVLYSLFPRESLEAFRKLVGVESKRSRKIIITGDSYSTIQLARALDKTDHKVTLVDPDPVHANEAAGELDRVQVIQGDCTQEDLLRDINVEAASFLIAASDEADYNMLSALLAKAWGAHEVISITTEWQHERLFRSIGIDHVLNPRLTAARAILEIISSGHIGAAVQLSHVDIEAVRFDAEPDAPFVGQPLAKIARKLKGAIVGMIVREDQMIIPSGDTTIATGDHVIMIIRNKQHGAISRLFKGR